jgi:hypothetical protein
VRKTVYYNQSEKQHPKAIQRQWAAFVQAGLSATGVSQTELGTAAQCSPSYVNRYAGGYVPCRAKARQFGLAVGNESGAMIAAGYIPEAGQDSPLSDNVRELLCILTFLGYEEQDALISTRVLEVVRQRIAQLSGCCKGAISA